MGLTQENRLAALVTPLGTDRLVLLHFEADEALGEPGIIVVSAATDTDDIDLEQLLGAPCAVRIRCAGGVQRWFHGIATEASWVGLEHGLYRHELVLRPWFWLQGEVTDCRLFRDRTVPDIIRDVFLKAGCSDFRLALTRDYPTLEYCVQYNESNMNFVSRLMEEYGIYYYFEHSADRHVMVLVDGTSGHPPVGGPPRRFIPLEEGAGREEEYFGSWSMARRLLAGREVLNDYDFRKPLARLVSTAVAPAGPRGRDGLEHYVYPGRYTDPSVGTDLARVGLDGRQAEDQRRRATGQAPTLFVGGRVQVAGHARASENGEHLLVRTRHVASVGAYGATDAGSDGEYAGFYELMPVDHPFRTARRTPQPRIHGLQTARVVGEEGEEITVDARGRIRVQFPWDREQRQSTWVRVAEVWAGRNWGGSFHPRHGQEVAVIYQEGDPDRPLVVGVLHNGDHPPVFSLPDEKTRGGWRSQSTPGGGGFNELSLEDRHGEEQVYLRAERDLDVLVQNAETREIGPLFSPAQGASARRTEIVNGDDELTVTAGDHKVTVGHDQTVDVANEISITAGRKITLTVGSSTVEIDPTSIRLSAMQIEIEAKATLQETALETKITASAVLTLQGGLVKIN